MDVEAACRAGSLRGTTETEERELAAQNFTGQLTTATGAATTVALATELSNVGTNPTESDSHVGSSGTFQTSSPPTWAHEDTIAVVGISLSTDSAAAIDVQLQSGGTTIWRGEVTAAAPVNITESELRSPGAAEASVVVPPGTAFTLVAPATAAAQKVDFDIAAELV